MILLLFCRWSVRPDFTQEESRSLALCGWRPQVPRASDDVYPEQNNMSRLQATSAFGCLIESRVGDIVDGRVAGHLGAAVSLKTLGIHVCVCPHFGM